MAKSVGELFIQLDFTVYRHFMCNNHHKYLPISLPFCDQQDILLPLTIHFLVSRGCQGPMSPHFQLMWTSCTWWEQSERTFLPNNTVNRVLCTMVLVWHSGMGKFDIITLSFIQPNKCGKSINVFCCIIYDAFVLRNFFPGNTILCVCNLTCVPIFVLALVVCIWGLLSWQWCTKVFHLVESFIVPLEFPRKKCTTLLFSEYIVVMLLCHPSCESLYPGIF
jgi:hypothetical protein